MLLCASRPWACHTPRPSDKTLSGQAPHSIAFPNQAPTLQWPSDTPHLVRLHVAFHKEASDTISNATCHHQSYKHWNSFKGKLLRDGVEHIWAFPSALIQSWTEPNNNIPLHAFFFSLRIVQHLLVIQVSNPLSRLVKVILQWLDQPFSGLRNQGVNVVRTVWTSIGLTTDKKVNVVRTAWKALGLNTDKKKRNFLLACSLFVCCSSGWICLSFFFLVYKDVTTSKRQSTTLRT